MAERAKFFDDIAGVAGGAFSALAGIGEEVTALVRARVDEAIAKLSLVRREEFDVVAELAASARAGLEQSEVRLAALEVRFAKLQPHADAESDHDPHAAHGAPGGPPTLSDEPPTPL
ncbi:accessory factor UbiK family protein [Lichenicoccus sp.]|uniref:accessory factor UbiK family protein n=1 Tax=Lichenicoccus sp. TaxID=2781899 RepID=UPI003D106534